MTPYLKLELEAGTVSGGTLVALQAGIEHLESLRPKAITRREKDSIDAGIQGAKSLIQQIEHHIESHDNFMENTIFRR